MMATSNIFQADTLERFSVASIAAMGRSRASGEIWRERFHDLNWREFSSSVEAARRVCEVAGVGSGSIVVVPGDARLHSLIWMFGVAAAGGIAAPLRTGRGDEIGRWAEYLEIGWQVEAGNLRPVKIGSFTHCARQIVERLRDRNSPGLLLATGGTTGLPKMVLHDLAVLLGTIKIRVGQGRRVLPLMRFDHIGGLDMAWRALASGQIIVAPPKDNTPDWVGETIAEHRVEILPATPSFLNLLLISGAASRHDLSSLRVISYGAEPMPRGLLDRLEAAFPQVEFIQRFGASEIGVLPVRGTGDGLLLKDDENEFGWKVVDGELWIRSPARALGYLSGETRGFEAEGWFRTGDLAEQDPDGTVRVLGRREDLINVGGEKVLPSEVEEMLLQHPLVADCRVQAEPNAILGQVVAADLVWRGGESSPVVVKRILESFYASRLARHKQPVAVRLVTEISTTLNFKKVRSRVS